MSSLLGLPPPNGSFSALGVNFDYTLLAIDLNASLSLGQAVTFTPTAINVDMSYGGQTDPGTLGKTGHLEEPWVFVVLATIWDGLPGLGR